MERRSRWGTDPAEHHHAAVTAQDLAFADLHEQEAQPTAGIAVWLRARFTDGEVAGVTVDGDGEGERALLDEVQWHCTQFDGTLVEHVSLTAGGLAMLRTDADEGFVKPGEVLAPDDVRVLAAEPHRAIVVVLVTRLTAVVLVVPYTHIDEEGGSVLAMPPALPMLDVDGIAHSPTYRRAVLALVEAFDDDVRAAARARLDA